MSELITPYTTGLCFKRLGVDVCEILDENRMFVFECFKFDADELVKRINGYEQLQAKNQQLVEALTQILGWRELRDDNGFPVKRVEEIAREAITNAKQREDV